MVLRIPPWLWFRRLAALPGPQGGLL